MQIRNNNRRPAGNIIFFSRDTTHWVNVAFFPDFFSVLKGQQRPRSKWCGPEGVKYWRSYVRIVVLMEGRENNNTWDNYLLAFAYVQSQQLCRKPIQIHLSFSHTLHIFKNTTTVACVFLSSSTISTILCLKK